MGSARLNQTWGVQQSAVEKMGKQLLLFSILILRIHAVEEEEDEKPENEVTVCGMQCITPCSPSSSGVFWCGQWGRDKSTGSRWDYCSPQYGVTINGEKCKNMCNNWDKTDYFWCITNDGNWNYCSPSKVQGNSNYGCYWTAGGIASTIMFILLMGFCLAVICLA